MEMTALAGMGKLNNGRTFSLLTRRISFSSGSIRRMSKSRNNKGDLGSEFRRPKSRGKHCVVM
jgi:hypothetical protein